MRLAITVGLGAPAVTGFIARVEARLQGRRGPRIRQPYYDLAKLFRKEALAPEAALPGQAGGVVALAVCPLALAAVTSSPPWRYDVIVVTCTPRLRACGRVLASTSLPW